MTHYTQRKLKGVNDDIIVTLLRFELQMLVCVCSHKSCVKMKHIHTDKIITLKKQSQQMYYSCLCSTFQKAKCRKCIVLALMQAAIRKVCLLLVMWDTPKTTFTVTVYNKERHTGHGHTTAQNRFLQTEQRCYKQTSRTLRTDGSIYYNL